MSQEPPVRQRDAFEGMLDYGRSTIRSLFALNGGAIVALLAFVSAILGHTPKPDISDLIPALASFIVGLSFAVGASFLGYLNFAAAHAGRYDTWLSRTQQGAMLCGIASGVAFLTGSYFTACFLATL